MKEGHINMFDKSKSKSIWKRPFKWIFLVLIVIVADVLLQVLAGATLMAHKSDWFVILSGLGFIIVIALLFRWMMKQQRKWATVKVSVKRRITVGLIGVLLMAATNLVNGFVPQSANQKGLNTLMGSGKMGLIFMSGFIILVPVIEEFIFRFMIVGPNPIGKHVKSKKSYGLRIIISAILFGAWHLQAARIVSLAGAMTALLTAVPYVLMGIVLACVYAYTQDIRVSTATHMIYNSIGVIMFLTTVGVI